LDARSAGIFGTGFVSSAVVGYMAIKFILRFIVHHSLRVFAYYRFGLTLVVAVLLLFRTAQDL
jgi:undecaprenyl-diphosphatase